MTRRKKMIAKMQTDRGFLVKCWRTLAGDIFPTNWKQQAGYLAGRVVLTKRQINRAKRRLLARNDYFRTHPVTAHA